MSELPPPEPPKPKPWWRRDFKRLPVLLWIGMAVVVVGAGVAVVNDSDGSDTPSKQVELCDSLRDPVNVNLHPSDWRRITGYTQRQLEAYVHEHCPTQSFKVLDN